MSSMKTTSIHSKNEGTKNNHITGRMGISRMIMTCESMRNGTRQILSSAQHWQLPLSDALAPFLLPLSVIIACSQLIDAILSTKPVNDLAQKPNSGSWGHVRSPIKAELLLHCAETAIMSVATETGRSHANTKWPTANARRCEKSKRAMIRIRIREK